MKENVISSKLLDICIRVHSQLGPGLYESVYETVLAVELTKAGLSYERQKPIPLVWDGVMLDQSFKADLIIENSVILEIKSVEHIVPVHFKQLLTYLKLTDLKLGLLVNFNVELLKHGVTRVVNNL